MKSKTCIEVFNKIHEHIKVHDLFNTMEEYKSLSGSYKQYGYVLTKGVIHNGLEGVMQNREVGFYVDIYFNEFTCTMHVGREVVYTGKLFRGDIYED